jgi:hypothetical protein
MNPSERFTGIRLLVTLPLAWLTSAALVLAEDTLVFAALALVWLGLACRWLAGRRAIVAKRALPLLIAAAVPAQGFAAAAIEISGPAHFHVASKSRVTHWHSGVMHHHHADGDAVVVDDGKWQAPAGEGKRFALGAVDALAAAAHVLPVSLPAGELISPRPAECAPHAPSPPERPPRLISVPLPL